MRISHQLVAAVLFCAAAAPAADPSLVNLIMPDARVVVFIDIAHIRSSALGPVFAGGVQNANPELQKLMDAAGFDPLRDLQEVLVATPGTGKNPPALLIARGTFDTTRLRAFAESAGSKITDWQGVPILTDPEKDSGAFALLDNTILAGNLAQIKAAIGRRGHDMVLNTEMAMRIADLSRRYDAWLVSIAPLATMAANLPADAKFDLGGLNQFEMLRSIEQFSVGVSMSSDFTIGAEVVANNEKAAGALADSVQMLLAMAQQSAKDQPSAMAALKNMNFSVDGNSVRLAFTMPFAEVQKAVQDAMNTQMNKGNVGVQQAAVAAPVITQAEVRPAVSEPVIQEASAAPLAAAPVAVTAPARPAGPVAKSPRIPPNGQLLIQSSPKDMGTVVIMGSKK